MSQTARTIAFIALSFTILIGWQAIMDKYYPPPPKPKITQHATPPPPVAEAPAAPIPTPAAPTPGAPTIESEETPGPSITIDTPKWTAEVSPRGGGLASFVLKGNKERQREQPGKPREGVNLASAGFGQPLPLDTDVGPHFGADAVYQVASRSDTELVLKRTRGGVTVTRRLSWLPQSYQLHLGVTVEGAPAGSLPVKVFQTSYQQHEEKHWYDIFAHYPVPPKIDPSEAECYIAGERSISKVSPLDPKPIAAVPGTPMFAAIDSKYFIGSIAPSADAASSPTSCSIGTPQLGGVPLTGHLLATVERTLTITAGTPATATFDLYFGPKDLDELKTADHELDRSVDLGFFGIIGRWIILPVLKIFHKIIPNWCVSIILLTVLMKFVTLPLTHKQFKSMQEGQKLQPEVEKIKAKYAGDQQRILQETQKMYKENNYNQFSGCLPLLPQLPIWYALYATLGASYELYGEPFIGQWLNDLTSPDPFLITPVLMTVTMIATQALTPQAQPPPPEMKPVLYLMPIMFGFFMLALPAGLVLYIFTNNVLSIGQSLYFRRKFPPPFPPAAK